MRRLGRALVLVLALALVLVAPPAAAGTPGAARACTQAAANPAGVQQLIRCIAPRLHVSTSTALYIARRESRYQPHAHNPRSSACGVFQIVSGTWRYFVGHLVYGRGALLGTTVCENGRANVILSLRYVRAHGWGPWS